MKLNSTQIGQTVNQLNVEAIPEDNPLMPQLQRLFGDHTYFLDRSGLNIVEPAEPDRRDGHTGVVVKLANWADGDLAKLVPHEPESTDVLVTLGTADA